jgi:hypothetical protein
MNSSIQKAVSDFTVGLGSGQGIPTMATKGVPSWTQLWSVGEALDPGWLLLPPVDRVQLWAHAAAMIEGSLTVQGLVDEFPLSVVYATLPPELQASIQRAHGRFSMEESLVVPEESEEGPDCMDLGKDESDDRLYE